MTTATTTTTVCFIGERDGAYGHDPRTCDHVADGQGWRAASGVIGGYPVSVKITVTPEQRIVARMVGGLRTTTVGWVIDTDTMDVGSSRWVQSCDTFEAWHIHGTTAWLMCRQGDHSCCTYSIERVFGAAPFHATFR